VEQRDGVREELGDIASTLLIVIGFVGLVLYLLYLKNPNVALYYALIALIIVGVLLALALAMLYFTRGVEHQGGLKGYERGLTGS
jgi:Na+/proline symporter